MFTIGGVDMNEDILLAEMGRRIISRRKQLRLTQDELAEKAGITSQTVSAAELGKKALRPQNILGICTALDISSDYLLTGVITDRDVSLLNQKTSDLSSQQFRHLEDIVNSFLAACRSESN